MTVLFHLSDPMAWAEARELGVLAPESLEREGFVHLSTPEQALRTAARWFFGREDLLLLSVDSEALPSGLCFEDTHGHGEAFPHFYGRLPLEAIPLVRRFPPGSDGSFQLPRSRPTAPRLSFLEFTAEDNAKAQSLWGDPQVTRWISVEPLPPDAIQSRLEAQIERGRRGGVRLWALELEGEFVGTAGLQPRASAPYLPELSFHLRPEAWGQGLGKEAARAVLAFAREVLVLDGVFAGHHPENRASAQILAGLGFVSTGEELYPPTGVLHRSYEVRFQDS